MLDGRGLRYARTAALVAVAAAAAAGPWAWGRWPGGDAWLLGGFVTTAIVGIVAGGWQAGLHGRPGAGFLAPLVVGTMEGAYKLDAPLKVDAKVGHDWLEMEEYGT